MLNPGITVLRNPITPTAGLLQFPFHYLSLFYFSLNLTLLKSWDSSGLAHDEPKLFNIGTRAHMKQPVVCNTDMWLYNMCKHVKEYRIKSYWWKAGQLKMSWNVDLWVSGASWISVNSSKIIRPRLVLWVSTTAHTIYRSQSHLWYRAGRPTSPDFQSRKRP